MSPDLIGSAEAQITPAHEVLKLGIFGIQRQSLGEQFQCESGFPVIHQLPALLMPWPPFLGIGRR